MNLLTFTWDEIMKRYSTHHFRFQCVTSRSWLRNDTIRACRDDERYVISLDQILRPRFVVRPFAGPLDHLWANSNWFWVSPFDWLAHSPAFWKIDRSFDSSAPWGTRRSWWIRDHGGQVRLQEPAAEGAEVRERGQVGEAQAEEADREGQHGWRSDLHHPPADGADELCLRLSSRLDTAVARVDTQVKMQVVGSSMGSIVKSIEIDSASPPAISRRCWVHGSVRAPVRTRPRPWPGSPASPLLFPRSTILCSRSGTATPRRTTRKCQDPLINKFL